MSAPLIRKIRRLFRDEQAQSLVEFGFSASVLLMSIFGVMECARALYVYHFVSYAAQQATRYAIVRGTHWGTTSCTSNADPPVMTIPDCNASNSDIQNYVQSIAPPGVTASSITVTTTWPGATVGGTSASCSTTQSTDGCLIKIKVTYPFSFIGPFMPRTAMNFAATSEETVQE